MNTSNFIKTTRVKLKLTQSELAVKVKKSRSTIANYEAGRIIPPGDVILKLQSVSCSADKHFITKKHKKQQKS